MAQNGILTEYDDLGHPSDAIHTAALTFAGGVVKAAPGRLLRIVVTTAFVGVLGTLVFYDSATAVASATPLFVIPVAAGVAGAIFTVDLPAVAGIAAVNTGGTLSAGAVTVGYS